MMPRPASFRCLLAGAGLALAVLPSPGAAQAVPAERPRNRPPSMLTGRAQWEKGAEMLKAMKVPPAPPLPPAEALRTFRVAPGYRVELVAAEPMVQNPIAFEFDPAGRIWVVEYQGYMRDINGTGEADPICRVVVLEDTDGDGRADQSTVFLDQLVMPRSITFVKGGVLLQEPPKIWFCEDADGDLRCDRRTEVGKLGVAGNPQHTGNGLRYGIDNWLHNADATTRHRWVDGRLIEEPVARSGQFGVSFDEMGRVLTCHESSALHADLIPGEYLVRNQNLAALASRSGRGFGGVDTNIATEAQQVYPIRVTPGITLGALELREDGRLRTYTIVSGACFYDGDYFPDDARGNVFVPEAGGNLIGRLKLAPGVRPKATRHYPAEQEFLASTDERFRPVNARVGPDGALYVADLYRGIIEHVIFMVPWISDQVRDRRLHEGLNLGRIYRVVRDDVPPRAPRPNLAAARSAELVATLNHAAGWWRITAQRLLVERRDPAAVPLLKELARRGPNALGRLHALWTLDGAGGLDADTRFAALTDPDERVRAAALRLCERGLDAAGQERLLRELDRLAGDRSDFVRLQAALTGSALARPAVLPILARIGRTGEDALFRTAILTGLAGRELAFVRAYLAENRTRATVAEHERQLLGLAVQCALESAQPAAADELVGMLGEFGPAAGWPREALLGGMSTFAANGKRRIKPVALAREPAPLVALARGGDPALRQTAYRLLELFTWPGVNALVAAGPAAAPLTAVEQKRIEAGREAFQLYCAPCHQGHGGGAPGLAPPLAGSEWVLGSVERTARIVLHGVYGPLPVLDQTWNLSMPGLGAAGALDDDKIAAVLSYVRRAWGNSASLVEPQRIAAIRRETAGRTLPWTAAELNAIDGSARPAVAAAVEPPIAAGATGEVQLPARRAVVYAQKLGYRPALDVLAPWTVAEDVAEWRVDVAAGGEFEVWVNLAADDSSAGDFYAVESEGSRTRGEVRSTGGYDQFQEQAAGRLTLRAGVNRILLRPDGPLVRELADVRGVRLRPVKSP